MTRRGTRYYVTWGGAERVVEVCQVEDALEVWVDGARHPVDVSAVEEGDLLNLLMEGNSVTYAVRYENGATVLSFHDREVRVGIEDERARMARLATGGGGKKKGHAEIRSVMPGVVKEILVSAEQPVEAGQPMLILEAMKMENEIRAPQEGIVGKIHVEAGQAVEKGAHLVTLAPLEAAAEPTVAPSAP